MVNKPKGTATQGCLALLILLVINVALYGAGIAGIIWVAFQLLRLGGVIG